MCVKKLISLGADVNFIIDGKYAILPNAIVGKRTEIVKTLINAGASVNKNTSIRNRDSILIYVIDNRYKNEIIQAIIKVDKKINHRNNNGDTALITAIKNYDCYAIKLLCEAGADINLADNRGYNPLMTCLRCGRVGIFFTLLEAGANIYSSDNEGNTILMIDIMMECKVFEKLLDLGVDPAHVNKSGDTALTLAIKNCRPNVAKKLIGLGVDVDHINNDKDTPLTLILQSRYHDDTIKEMILEKTRYLI